MAHIHPEDIKIIRRWRQRGYLKDFNPLVTQAQGLVWTPCSDGDQFHDWYQHQRAYNERIHVQAGHGGACVLGCDELAELLKPFALAAVADALRMKNMSAVVLSAHYPCGWAQAKRLSVEDQMALLKAAVTIVRTYLAREGFPAVTVFASWHVDYGHKKREYLLNV